MKASIHPQYYPSAQVVCACGNTFSVGSTKDQIKVELCFACHPFYTGQQKFVDTVGKIERFQEKQKAAAAVAAVVKAKKIQKQTDEHAPRTLREMLMATK